jgi:hypothetical protein
MRLILSTLAVGLALLAAPPEAPGSAPIHAADAVVLLQPALALAALPLPNPGGSSTVAGLSATCIRSFYNPQMYNWYSFQNNCGQAVHLVWIANNPNDHFGAASGDLAPGQTQSTGWSASEIQQKQGLSIFVCPSGYTPVDPSTHQMVRSPTQGFVCQQW